MTQAYIKTLKDKDGNIIYPQTSLNAVTGAHNLSLADLNEDENHRTVTDIEKATWNGISTNYASKTKYGLTKLSSATNSTDETLAATPKAVKTVQDYAANVSKTVNMCPIKYIFTITESTNSDGEKIYTCDKSSNDIHNTFTWDTETDRTFFYINPRYIYEDAYRYEYDPLEIVYSRMHINADIDILLRYPAVSGIYFKCHGVYDGETDSYIDTWTMEGDAISSEKFITGTLAIGQTLLELPSEEITSDSMIDIYTSVYGVNPINVEITSAGILLVFEPQGQNIDVKVAWR